MDKLHTILYDSSLAIVEQDTSTVEAFSSLQNYYRAIAPYNTEWIPYVIFYPTNSDDNVGVPAEYLVMANIDTTTIDGETYYVYETNFPAAVVGSARANKIDVTIAFIAKAEDLIGVSRYDEDAAGYNDTTYIAAQLLIDYDDAVSGNYVRVFNTETDWLFNGTAWTDTNDITVTSLEEHRSDTASYTLRKGTSTTRPTHAPNNTESIIAILNTKISSTEAYNAFYTKTNADLRFVNVTGDIMSGDLDFDDNNIDNVKEISIRDESANEVATLRYLHTNGNNYQVVQIVYPDGRVEELNEVHEYNYNNRTGITLNSGIVLMTDGLTQGNQAVDGYLYDEASEYSMNVVGVVTVDGIANNGKSKATYMGIVHEIAESDFYSSGTAYAEGQILYARGGKLSNVAPTKPNRIVRMGAVINKVSTKFDVVLAPLVYLNITELSDSTFTQINGNVPISDGNKLINFDLTTALSDIDDAKVDKTTTIATIDLQDNITVEELLIAIGNATESVAGFLSEEDKRRLNLIYLAYGEFPDADDIVNTLTEIMAIMTQYEEAVDLVDFIGTKLNHDFTSLTAKSTPVAADLFAMGDSVNGYAAKKVTWQEILDAIFIASDAFSSSTDYKSEGLGANKTAFVTRHTLSLVTGGVVSVDIKAPLTEQEVIFTLPTLVSTNKIQISTDNGVTYYDLLNVAATIPANTLSEERIKAYFNGSAWIYDTTLDRIEQNENDIIVLQAHDIPSSIEQSYYKSIDSTFGAIAPVDFASPLMKYIYGLSVNQMVEGVDVIDTGTVQFDSVTGTSYYDSFNGVIIVGDDTQKTITNNSGGTLDIWVIEQTGSLVGKTASEMATQFPTYLPYGYNDLINPEFKFTGLNLIGDLEFGSFSTTTGEEVVSTVDVRNITPMPVQGGQTIYIKYPTSGNSIVFEYDGGMNFIGYTIKTNDSSLVLDSNTSYINIFANVATWTNELEEEVMISLSDVDYRAYASPTDNFKLLNIDGSDIAVREVGSIRDTIEWVIDHYEYVQRVGFVEDESIGATINYADMPTGGVFAAFDSVNNEYQSGVKGDTLTLTGVADIRYELTTAEDGVELDQDGSTYQEITTTIEQVSLASDYTVKYPLNSEAQGILNTFNIQGNKRELTRLDELKWTDLNVAMTQSVQGNTQKPDYDFTNLGLLFPQNDATEIVYATFQFPHGYAEGSSIEPHIHVGQALDLQAVFKIDYKWVNIGDTLPASWTTITLDTYLITYVSGTMHQILKAAAHIDGTGKKISSILKIRLYRDDNVYTGDMLVSDLDVHYQQDSKGSVEEYSK